MKLQLKNPNTEDSISGWSHVFGAVLALIGTVTLFMKNFPNENLWNVGSTFLFGVTLILLYSTSSAYHLCRPVGRKKQLRKLDHSAIYLLIAGTYTPFCLITLRESGAWGWLLLAAVWGVAIMGIFMSYRKLKDNASLVKTIGYIGMGMMFVCALPPLVNALTVNNNIEALYWLGIGGLFYIVGCVPYMLSKYRGMHSLWHIFVMSGSACHFIAIWSL